MKYFDVEKEILVIKDIRRYGVCTDCTPATPSYDVDYEEKPKEIVAGFTVYEFDEDDTSAKHIEFYPVETNMATYENNEQEVLDKIREKYDPSEWQNNNW